MNGLDLETLDRLLARIRGASVVVLGDLILDDYVLGDADRLSPEAPVPVVAVSEEYERLGGAANVARNLVDLGATPRLVGVVGDDDAGRRLTAAIGEAGMDASGLVTVAGRRTGIKTRVVCRGQQVVRIDRETVAPVPAAATTELAARLQAMVGDATALIVSDYGKGVVSAESLPRLLADLPAGLFSCVDPVPAHMPLYAGIRATTPNERETLTALGLDPRAPALPADELVRRMRERFGFDEVYVTLGARGVSWATADGQPRHEPTQARAVYDVSGAGDTVVAVLSLLRGLGVDTVTAVRVANLAAGLVVAKPGTASVTPDELRAAVAAS